MGHIHQRVKLSAEKTVTVPMLVDTGATFSVIPEALARDEDALARFHNEVRTARHVSHPNVCRVYDVGQADGQTFLSMEYVDGEDLASLLRRIGRLPGDKALEIARQLCAGLLPGRQEDHLLVEQEQVRQPLFRPVPDQS